MIWVTRGRTWGHRFLRTGGHEDALSVRDRLFASTSDGAELRRAAGLLGLRFPDPEGRRDEVGRPIFHELILDGEEAADVATLEEGIARFWPEVAEDYERIWNQA